jgi:hypothetical protein
VKYLLLALVLLVAPQKADEAYPGQSEHKEPPKDWMCKRPEIDRLGKAGAEEQIALVFLRTHLRRGAPMDARGPNVYDRVPLRPLQMPRVGHEAHAGFAALRKGPSMYRVVTVMRSWRCWRGRPPRPARVPSN